MSRTKLSREEQRQRKEERKGRALDWKLLRKNNFLTQKKLAEILGVSRRTIQQVEGGYVTPHPTTLLRFAVFKKSNNAVDLNLQA